MIHARAKAGATTGRPPAADGGVKHSGEAQEIELKLEVATPDPARLVRHPFIRRFQDGTASSRRLHTVYYDTPDLRLATAGVTLRIRHQGGERVQGVRTVSGSGVVDTAAVGVHREWLWTLRSDGPDLLVLRESGVRDVVTQDALPRIGPVFFSDVQRTTLTLRPEPSSAIEVSADSGEIRAGRSFRPVHDIDLVLKAGPVEALFDLALALHRTTPLRVAMRTKAETGLALVTGRPPPTPSAPPLTLIAVATVADGFRHIVRNGINHLLANEPAVREAGPAAAREGLHQMGAALRRLRTAFALFGDTIAAPEAPRLDHELRWIARRLKPARAWDKAATLAWAPFAASHPDLDAAIAAAHAGALEQARSALAAPRVHDPDPRTAAGSRPDGGCAKPGGSNARWWRWPPPAWPGAIAR